MRLFPVDQAEGARQHMTKRPSLGGPTMAANLKVIRKAPLWLVPTLRPRRRRVSRHAQAKRAAHSRAFQPAVPIRHAVRIVRDGCAWSGRARRRLSEYDERPPGLLRWPSSLPGQPNPTASRLTLADHASPYRAKYSGLIT